MKVAMDYLLPSMLVAAGLGSVQGASFDLSDEQLRSAIRFGQAGAKQRDLGAEWTLVHEGGHKLTVSTPFYRAASLARSALNAGEAVHENSVRESLEGTRGKLIFRLEMKVDGPESARNFKPELTG